MTALQTPFSEHQSGIPLPEYPRPQFVRESFLNLNGTWEYFIGKQSEVRECPAVMQGEILVPFSPECARSGVLKSLSPEDVLFYRRTFTFPEDFCRGRVLLHFGAVDQIARVYVNGHFAVESCSGYLPFEAEITGLLRKGENELTLTVTDPTDTKEGCRGKQSLHPKGIWYTAQSGIWQTVWLESVPKEYISSLRITPNFDDASVELTAKSESEGEVLIKVLSEGKEIASASGRMNAPVVIPLPGFRAWSPEDPFLYDVEVSFGEDLVKSYFGMRKFSVERGGDGCLRLFLNGRETFHTGVLDQGYWPESLYTPPSDEAMVYDILTMKRLGFNMLRKHIKIEPLRWYYHCDRLGMLVWQDMVNGGGKYSPLTVSLPLITERHRKDSNYSAFARKDESMRKQFLEELKRMVNLLYNAPCIAMWVPFNEGWGQFDAKKAEALIKSLDVTRTVDHASGWHDQGGGETKSLHVYFKPIRIRSDERAILLTEFGGYSLPVPGHTESETEFGYKKIRTEAELSAAVKRLYEEEVLPAKQKGLAAAVYTQLSDVETELNGLVTYDRRCVKIDGETMRVLNARLLAPTGGLPKNHRPLGL